ncbi:hypothetical protein PO654_15760 [Phytobacter diazotrophicus]|uniref:hypothetical protein n=1 Tax=Phytobacter diazotrophicus TaxID=395631 RepID=UPI0013EDD2C8|nr:hypothetical protein [Phytobacter diazotrophicus]QIH63037.1 hypothetical protein CRX67_07830 [Enterobacteriaceae bacterium A-F18]
MDMMMTNVSVLAPLGIGLLVWAIAGCTISSTMQDKNRSKLVARVSGTLGGFVLGFVCLVASIIYFSDSSTETNEPVSTSTESTSQKSLDINVDTLTTRMQKNLIALGSTFRIHFQTKKLDHSTVSEQKLDEHNAILITSDNNTGMITSMMIVTSGDGTMNGGFNVLHTVLSAVSATLGESEMKSGKSSEIVMGLIKHTYPNDEVFVGKLRYSIVSSNDGLNSFFISRTRE